MAPRMQTAKISFEGGLDLRSTTQDLQSKPGLLVNAVNFEQNIGGGYRRINGFTPVGTGTVPGVGKIKGIFIYEQGIVACRDDGIYHTFDGNSWLQVNKDLNTLSNKIALDSANELPRPGTGTYTFDVFTHGALGGRTDLLIHDGFNKPAVLTVIGATHESATYRYVEISDVDRGSYGLFHDDQHIIAGDSQAPSSFYVSSIADAEDFSGSLSGLYSVADPIIGLKSFREILYIFCKNSIWRATGLNTAQPLIEPVTRNIGCVDNATIQEVGGDILFLSTDGIRSLGATERIGDISFVSISQPINQLIRDILQDRERYTFSSTVIREKNQYRLFYTDENLQGLFSKGIIATYFSNEQTNSQWSFTEIDGIEVTSVHSSIRTGTETHVHGTTDGSVHYQDVGSTFNGVSIYWMMETPSFDLGDVGLRKNIHDLTFYIEQEGSLDVSAKLVYDYELDTTHQPVAYPIVQQANPFIWGVGLWGEGTWGSRITSIDKLHVQGSCNTLAVRLESVGTDSAPFTVQGFNMNFTPSGRI